MLPQLCWRDIGSHWFDILASTPLKFCLQALFLFFSMLYPPLFTELAPGLARLDQLQAFFGFFEIFFIVKSCISFVAV
jgi:hypothetical protein